MTHASGTSRGPVNISGAAAIKEFMSMPATRATIQWRESCAVQGCWKMKLEVMFPVVPEVARKSMAFGLLPTTAHTRILVRCLCNFDLQGQQLLKY